MKIYLPIVFLFFTIFSFAQNNNISTLEKNTTIYIKTFNNKSIIRSFQSYNDSSITVKYIENESQYKIPLDRIKLIQVKKSSYSKTTVYSVLESNENDNLKIWIRRTNGKKYKRSLISLNDSSITVKYIGHGTNYDIPIDQIKYMKFRKSSTLRKSSIIGGSIGFAVGMGVGISIVTPKDSGTNDGLNVIVPVVLGATGGMIGSIIAILSASKRSKFVINGSFIEYIKIKNQIEESLIYR